MSDSAAFVSIWWIYFGLFFPTFRSNWQQSHNFWITMNFLRLQSNIFNCKLHSWCIRGLFAIFCPQLFKTRCFIPFSTLFASIQTFETKLTSKYDNFKTWVEKQWKLGKSWDLSSSEDHWKHSQTFHKHLHNLFQHFNDFAIQISISSTKSGVIFERMIDLYIWMYSRTFHLEKVTFQLFNFWIFRWH